MAASERGNSSCVASAIAKSEATLEERLNDLKESLAQDGVIPDDFMTFEAWKAGQLQVVHDADDGKDSQLGLKVHNKTPNAETGTFPGPSVPHVSVDTVLQAFGKQSDTGDQPHTPAATAAHSKKAVAPQKSPPLAPHRYNYASPDCSARIHSASPQSQHASSVLHKSKDRYMLTPCSAKEHWAIIELCDDIRIEAVEIGMFEFFSGIVKEVRVSIGGADDDDIDEEDKSAWQEVGSFVGRSVRGTQIFSLDHPTSFHRFIRLDFPSYYGNEYYCPISSIKVYGMNQMEAFKWESRKQKELEIARRRLEEDNQRAQQTVTKVGTLLESQTSPALSALTINLVSFSPSPSATSIDVPLQDAKTVDSGYSALLTSVSTSFSGEETTPASEPVESGEIKRSYGTAPPASSSSAAVPSPRRTFLFSRDLEDIATTSGSAVQDSKPSSTTQSKASAPAASRSSTTLSLATTSPTPSTSNVSSGKHRNMPSPPGSPRHEAKADGSESIYAYIIRRLNALEGNSTLGMMYMEEQTKATRGILQNLENHLADWKLQVDSSQKAAIEHEVCALEKAPRSPDADR